MPEPAAPLPARPLLLDLKPEDWDLAGAPEYRRRQLIEWIYTKRANSFEVMANLPKDLRSHLERHYRLNPLELVTGQGSGDTTRKFLFQLHKGDYIESVLIPASPALYGERSDRHTLCLSTQVGCAYGCKFCASGLDGWKRNLTPGEIHAQIMEVERHGGKKINNLVFMGMGEPLANFDNLMVAIDVINADWGLNIGARHITISTSGLVPRIRDLADQPRQLRLAISLHGASNSVRDQIMPVNKKYPVEELLEACAYFQSKKKKMITFEYILIEGINDQLEQARLLVRHARKLHAKINLIPYNTVEGLDWNRPNRKTIHAFADILKQANISCTIRLEKGHDIAAACGQLRLKQIKS
ncbi:MAG: 23S rRNA (adenine(2503)-C(2))-methyltransferase RlmN [Blastochloris sp.]|nr:23S rRNA (adenine(2503)-C(2))-methyltransferase RlmN [Blastochloris sp.]